MVVLGKNWELVKDLLSNPVGLVEVGSGTASCGYVIISFFSPRHCFAFSVLGCKRKMVKVDPGDCQSRYRKLRW